MRTPRLKLPPNVLISPVRARWAVVAAGVVLLSVVIAVVVGVFGLFGFAADPPEGVTVEAKVVTSATCDGAGGTETVTLTVAGRERQVRFDGCGHQPGESVEVRIPPGLDSDLVVQAAQAASGAAGQSRGFGLIMLVLSGIAGAAYALLVVPGLGRLLRAQVP